MKTNNNKKASEKSNQQKAAKKNEPADKRKKKPSILDEFEEFNDIDFDMPEPIDDFYDDDDDLY